MYIFCPSIYTVHWLALQDFSTDYSISTDFHWCACTVQCAFTKRLLLKAPSHILSAVSAYSITFCTCTAGADSEHKCITQS